MIRSMMAILIVVFIAQGAVAQIENYELFYASNSQKLESRKAELDQFAQSLVNRCDKIYSTKKIDLVLELKAPLVEFLLHANDETSTSNAEEEIKNFQKSLKGLSDEDLTIILQKKICDLQRTILTLQEANLKELTETEELLKQYEKLIIVFE
jgi:hypothetical protein